MTTSLSAFNKIQRVGMFRRTAQIQNTCKEQRTHQPNSTLNCPEDSMMASRVSAEMSGDRKSNRCTNFDRGSRCFDLSRASHTCDQDDINLRHHEGVDTLTSPSEVCAVRYSNRMAPDTVDTPGCGIHGLRTFHAPTKF